MSRRREGPSPAHYEALGVSPNATRAQITEAYRNLVQIYHPDRHVDSPPHVRDEADRRMKELNEAYAILRQIAPNSPRNLPPRPSGIANIRSAALWLGTAPGSWARTARRAGTPGPDVRPAGANATVARIAREHTVNTRVARERREELRRSVLNGDARPRPKPRNRAGPHKVMAGMGLALSTNEVTCSRCRSIQRLPPGWSHRLDDTDYYCCFCDQVVMAR